MKKLKFHLANINFEVDDKPIKFQVVHNLPNIKGLSFDDALENWVYRTNKYTSKSLCEYIMNKNTGYMCMTLSKWERLNKAVKIK